MHHILFEVILGFLAKVFGGIMAVAVVVQILCRYLPLNFAWTEELARLMFMWFSFTGAALTFGKNKHLSIDLLYLKFSPAVQRVLNIFGQLVIFAFSAIICYYGFHLLKIVSMQTSPMLRISMKYFYAAVPYGGLLFCLGSLRNLLHYLTGGERLHEID